eukprot:scaffold14630_cov221-Alexandrium_tamarense.AAC.1
MTTPRECGDPSKYCKEGSTEPSNVREGYFSLGGTNITRYNQTFAPLGHYAKGGVLFKCAEGHYGDKVALTTDECSGLCEEGWYCPTGSTSQRQIVCGGAHHFCPTGSSSPQKVQDGYYTTKDQIALCGPGQYRKFDGEEVHTNTSPIATKVQKGDCVLCPDKTFKIVEGAYVEQCQPCGPHAKGTPDRMTCECHQSATDRLSTKLHFDVKTKTCVDITGDEMKPPDIQYYSDSRVAKVEEFPCEPGFYCQDGLRYSCPDGRYGDKHLETNFECSGHCNEGHWCGRESTSPTQNKCGGTNVYCPPKSPAPQYVPEGYYSSESEPYDMRTSIHLCSPGFYCDGHDGLRKPCRSGYFGNSTGSSKAVCDGKCLAGYYCPEGSTSPTQVPCGNASVICPENSSNPRKVLTGYYSASEHDILLESSYSGPNSTQDTQLECEVGYYCKDGIKIVVHGLLINVFVASPLLVNSQYQCPGGSFGRYERTSDVNSCEECRAGYYCPSYPNGPTTEDTMMPCGESFLYCPPGSAFPRGIDVGYYGISPGYEGADESDDTMMNRVAQVICPPGHYCEAGFRYKCRPGTYGEVEGLVDKQCSGLCPSGFFCPEQTIHPLPCSPGSYATGGASQCTSCEVPLTVSMKAKNEMCRDDRSCCFDIFE